MNYIDYYRMCMDVVLANVEFYAVVVIPMLAHL